MTHAAQIAVIFGARGGMGRALLRHLRHDPSFDNVVSFSRASDPAIELTDEASLQSAAGSAAAQGDLRLVIDATGFLHDDVFRPEKSWREIDPAHLARSFALNAIGPALIMKHVLPLFPRAGRCVFVTLSARVGSIGDNRLGGWYGYRASKAALNQIMRTASIELKRRNPASLCVSMHPGTVNTALSSPFAKSDLDIQSPDVASQRLLLAIAQLRPEDTGGFFDQMGQPIPW